MNEVFVVRMGPGQWDLGFSVKNEEGSKFYRYGDDVIIDEAGDFLDEDDESFDKDLVEALDTAACKFLAQEVRAKFETK